ncbi:hypothetical protein F4778DRAFT_799050 [Xylariomycetidae sp. FL2044]|nr:hypothetical protein F4778DRAFT_799050 [Xylariomycetidae sp. FL2044]
MTPVHQPPGFTVAIIGCGKLGSAVLQGLLQSRPTDQYRIHDKAAQHSPRALERVLVSVRTQEKAQVLAEKYGERDELACHLEVVVGNNVQAATGADVVVLACLPGQAAEVLGVQGMPEALARTLLLSMLGGVSVAELEDALYSGSARAVPENERCHTIVAIPNLAAARNQSITVIGDKSASLPDETLELGMDVIHRIGNAMSVSVEQMPTYLQAGPEARKKYLDALIQSFQDYGFVRLANHGVSPERVKQMFDLADDLFHRDHESKLKFANIADGSPQRGYSAIGVEKTASLHGKLVGRNVDEKLTDAREHFDCGSPLDQEFENRWPADGDDGFRREMEAFYFEMERVTADILASLEEGLGSPAGTLNKLISHQKNASELRLNHYPPVPASLLRGGQVSRIWPHFDLGVITLLFTSSTGGLEVEDRKAAAKAAETGSGGDGVGSDGGGPTFIPVEPETEGELIVNISETLQRWTDDRLPAGLHRVSTPKELEASIQADEHAEIPRRYSIAFLAKADRQAPVGTIPVFQTGKAPRYKDMTALEYHRSRLLTAY